MRAHWALAAVIAGAVAVPAPAAGSFPGENGPLVVSLGDCEFSRYLAVTPWRGGPLTPLMERCPNQEDGDPGPSFGVPDAAPSGRFVLANRLDWSGRSRFVRIDPDGGEAAEIPLPPGIRLDPMSHVAGSLSPSGRRFAIAAPGEPLWAVEIDGSRARKIRPAARCGRRSCEDIKRPRWSPDGRVVAVEISGELWLIRTRDGKRVRRIAQGGTDVDWSPDGRCLVYATVQADGHVGDGALKGALYVVGRDGRGRRRLTAPRHAQDSQPRWSPDGRWIAWVRTRFGPGDVSFDVKPSLWRMRATGGEPRYIRRLPPPWMDEGEYEAPQLTWLPRP